MTDTAPAAEKQASAGHLRRQTEGLRCHTCRHGRGGERVEAVTQNPNPSSDRTCRTGDREGKVRADETYMNRRQPQHWDLTSGGRSSRYLCLKKAKYGGKKRKIETDLRAPPSPYLSDLPTPTATATALLSPPSYKTTNAQRPRGRPSKQVETVNGPSPDL